MESAAEREPQYHQRISSMLDDDSLTQLLEEAESSGEIDAWCRYADALAERGKTGRALRVLEECSVEFVDSGILDDCRFQQVRIARAAGLVSYMEYMLRRIAKFSKNDRSRKFADGNLRILLEWRQKRDEDKRLNELQLAYVTEGLHHGRTGPEHYAQLAKLMLKVGQAGSRESRVTSAIGVLEKALKVHPDSVSLLENLANCLEILGRSQQLDETLIRLEELKPDSAVVRRFSGKVEPIARPEIGENTFEIASFLVDQTAKEDSEQADAAIADLQIIVTEWPGASVLHLLLGFAFLNAGNRNEALEQARLLGETAGRSHERHFNAAQLFRACAELLHAQNHAKLALHYAVTGQDRVDAQQLLSSLAAET